MAIPKILFFIIILQLIFSSFKTSGKSKPVCVFRCSFCPGPFASTRVCGVSTTFAEPGRPTCQADALGAVAEVHHHPDLQGERAVSSTEDSGP